MNSKNDFFQKKTVELLQNFHNLTGIKICLYDASGNELYYFPQKLSGFCSVLRQNPLMEARCKECERLATSECKKRQGHYQYTCHAGLIECVTPVLYGKKVLGYVMIGQVRKKGQYFDKIKHLLGDGDLTALENEYSKLHSLSPDKVNSAICILDACAGYEYLKNIMSENKQSIDAQITNYVNENLVGDLSVQTLCREFKLSNNELYAVFKQYFASTPAEYVKNRRLNVACELLESTKLKVNAVCKNVGIEDYNYFSKIFKKKFNLSPSEFRKSVK